MSGPVGSPNRCLRRRSGILQRFWRCARLGNGGPPVALVKSRHDIIHTGVHATARESSRRWRVDGVEWPPRTLPPCELPLFFVETGEGPAGTPATAPLGRLASAIERLARPETCKTPNPARCAAAMFSPRSSTSITQRLSTTPAFSLIFSRARTLAAGTPPPIKIAERPRHVAVIAVVILQRNIQELREVGVAAVGCWSSCIHGDFRAEDSRGPTSSWTTAGEAVVIVPSMSKALAEGFGLRRGSGWLILFARGAVSGRRGGGVVARLIAAQRSIECSSLQTCHSLAECFLQATSKQHGHVATCFA